MKYSAINLIYEVLTGLNILEAESICSNDNGFLESLLFEYWMCVSTSNTLQSWMVEAYLAG